DPMAFAGDTAGDAAGGRLVVHQHPQHLARSRRPEGQFCLPESVGADLAPQVKLLVDFDGVAHRLDPSSPGRLPDPVLPWPDQGHLGAPASTPCHGTPAATVYHATPPGAGCPLPRNTRCPARPL